MTTTGFDCFVGYPPQVSVTERQLLSALPEHERTAFAQHLGNTAQRTRSGEIVFPVSEYAVWKSRHNPA